VNALSASGAKYATSWTGSNIVHIARAALVVSATTAPFLLQRQA
jgi:hypothetical protein